MEYNKDEIPENIKEQLSRVKFQYKLLDNKDLYKDHLINIFGFPTQQKGSRELHDMYHRLGSINEVQLVSGIDDNQERKGTIHYRNIKTLKGVSGAPVTMAYIQEKGQSEMPIQQPKPSNQAKLSIHSPVIGIHRSEDPNKRCNVATLLTS